MQPARLRELVAFIVERHSIYLRRAVGEPKPWTQDPVLQRYRFCNVYRELDTVTHWIAENWRRPHANDPDLWFAMCVARLVNWPDSLKEVGYPIPWRPRRFKGVMTERKSRGMKTFTSAYIINQAVTGGYGMSKSDYLADVVLKQLWTRREVLRPVLNESLRGFHARLMTCYGMGTFLAAQVVADMKYNWQLAESEDWWTFAASGPGSRRGMNVVHGLDPKTPEPEGVWLEKLTTLRDLVNKKLPGSMESLHAQDLQNCLCEFSKYTRGYSRTTYQGA